MWEGLAGQMLGAGMGIATQQRDLSAMAGYDPYSQGNYIPIIATTTTSNALHLTGADGLSIGGAEEAALEPPDEFTQLSNHKFHELLDRFAESA